MVRCPQTSSRLVFLRRTCPDACLPRYSLFSSSPSPSSSSSFMARSFGRWPVLKPNSVYVFNYRTYSSSLEFHGAECAEMRGQRVWIIDQDNRPSWNSPRLLLYFSFSTSTLGISCVRSLKWTHVASRYRASVSSRISLSSSFGLPRFEQMLVKSCYLCI